MLSIIIAVCAVRDVRCKHKQSKLTVLGRENMSSFNQEVERFRFSVFDSAGNTLHIHVEDSKMLSVRAITHVDNCGRQTSSALLLVMS